MTYQGVFLSPNNSNHLYYCCAGFPAIAGEREEYTFAFKLFQDEKYIFAKDQFKAYLENYPEGENAGRCTLPIRRVCVAP